jgi:formylglycine-generating enzyme required for sulfatase activity
LGIVSTRFGTATGSRDGGTEKEFKEALEKWKEAGAPWIMLYFADQPQLSGDPEQVQQYLEVCRLRQALEAQGIVASYKGVRGSHEAFYEKVSEHLQAVATTFNLEKRFPSDATAENGLARTIPREYLEWLMHTCGGVELLGLRAKEGSAIRLQHIYVPLTTSLQQDERRQANFNDREVEVQLLLDLLEEQSLYVPGSPGSGKSTFCRWVAWLACVGSMPVARVSPPSMYVETFPQVLLGRLPLLISLREFWSFLPQHPGRREMTAAEIESAISQYVDAKRYGRLTSDVMRQHLEDGSLLLILDGLDEIPLSGGDPENPCEPRAMFISGLNSAAKTWTLRNNRLLLTSRPYAMSDAGAHKSPLRTAPISELDLPMRALLVERWFDALVEQPDAAKEQSHDMLSQIAGRHDLQDLASNPMLLTAMCIVYLEGRRLPQDRHDLYDRIVDNVLYSRFPEGSSVIRVRNRLAVVAYGMHTGEGLGEERSVPQAEATYHEIDRMFQQYLEQTSWTESGYTGAVEAREHLLSTTGLLLPRGEHRAGFYHFSFQEYLAAERIFDLRRDELVTVFVDRANVHEWRSTLTFLFALQLARHSSPQRSIDLLVRLLEELSHDKTGLAVVIGDCLRILLERGFYLKPEKQDAFRQYCESAIEREVPIAERTQLGLALGALGDPRITPDLRDSQGYAEIGAGSYPLGEKQREQSLSWTQPLNEQAFALHDTIRLSLFPVTNSQFSVFIEHGGYEEREWWSESGWQWRTRDEVHEPSCWRNSNLNAPNQPVVGVSFWEAEAFARWMGGRLPTECEWEAAARGPNGFIYPWGNEWVDGVCNSYEAGLSSTSPVGIFPRSRSAEFGLYDMVGNVWEWCSDVWDQARVVRGGSWGTDALKCRATSRYGLEPHYRDATVGFRIVLE